MASKKEVRAKLKVFLKWEFHSIFGYKLSTDAEYIESVWCKACAKHSNKNLKPNEVKGVTEACSDNFINGTSFVTKHTVSRYLVLRYSVRKSCLSMTYNWNKFLN